MGSLTRMLLRIAINAAALWLTAWLLDGMDVTSNIPALLGVAVIFGVMNGLVRPILSFFTCALYALTLGLFTFIMNVIILWLTEMLSTWIFGEAAISFDGFFSMLVAGVVISVISFLLSWFLPDEK